MALEDLPGELVTPTRAEIIAKYQRDVKLRNPESEIGPGTQPELDARLLADHLMPLYADAVLIANGMNEDAATGKRLDRVGERYGLPRGKARGARGFVAVTAAAGGGTILEGTEAKSRQTGRRYAAAETRFVQDGGHIAVRGIDTGPLTDLPPGAVLQWTNPPPGIGPLATVVAQADGRGLTGGADAESDESYLRRIRDRRRNPPASGNDAQIREALTNTPDVPIEQVYTYPAVFGPGSTAFTFTVLAPKLGDSRKPTTAQLAAALVHLESVLPPDSCFPVEILSDPIDVAIEIEWANVTRGWTDRSPWPPRYTGSPGPVVVSIVNSAIDFTLKTADDDYSGVVQPVVGQTIGMWDPGASTFRKKQIKTISGSGPWDITCETANGASDTSFTPSPGTRVFPWSESAPLLVDAVLKYMAKLGPGEMFTSFPGEDRRRRRNPLGAKEYPQKISSVLATALLELDAVQNATIVEGAGVAPTIGTPGIEVYMLELGNLCLFPFSS